jgi:hypothetical protein
VRKVLSSLICVSSTTPDAASPASADEGEVADVQFFPARTIEHDNAEQLLKQCAHHIGHSIAI